MNKARKLLHRDSAPILSFSSFGAKKNEERRKSEFVAPSSPKSPKLRREQQREVSLPKFYIKGINRGVAEEILNYQPVGIFLVRDRETSNSPGSYTLSLKHKEGLKHHKIETNPSNKLIIAGYERFQFDNLEQLTEFFIKSQKKDIDLVPYNPDGISTRMQSMTLEQPTYEEMDDPEDIAQALQSYQTIDEAPDTPTHSSYLNVPPPETHGYSSSHQNGQGPPPLPTRRDKPGGPQPTSYENLNRQQKSVPLPQKPQQKLSYENMRGKGAAPPPPPLGATSAPPIPRRIAPESHSSLSYEIMDEKSSPPSGSYENMADIPSPPPQRGSYQNVPDRPKHGPGYENYGNKPTGYENYFSKSKPPPTLVQQALQGGHSYQNLPPKVTPRRVASQVNFSAEQALPSRKPVPLRRVKTDTERDYNARRL